jgi:CBS domain-containing protein
MNAVRDILKEKGSRLWQIGPEETVYQALSLMAAKNVGALLVIKEGAVVGIFSERDYCRNVILDERSPKTLRVSGLMTRDVMCVSPERTAEECMALMTDKRIRHLPVLDNQKIVGVISIGDVVKKIIENQQFTISELGNYITAG